MRVFDIDAVPVTLSNLTVQRGNIAGRGAGIRSLGVLTLTNVSIFSNTAQLDGGGAYISGALTVSSTAFISNTAIGDGGGAYTGNQAIVDGAWFERNQSSGDGGGLYVFRALTLTNTNFISDAAIGSGGGVFAYGIVQVAGGRFENNQSTSGAGGGLFTGSLLTLQDTAFISNTALLDGGGARAFGATQVTGGRFERNQAMADGGGLYVPNTAALTGTQFISNTAHSGGGGAYISGALTLTNTRFISNSADSGGGAHTDSPAVLWGAWFEQNQSAIGGGLYANHTLSMTDTQFLSNAASQGGGVYTVGPVQLDGGRFDHNQAYIGGGLEIDGDLQMAGTTFVGNIAANEGGGIYALGLVQLDGGLFEHNQSSQGGGLDANTTLIMSGTQFISNTAHDFGGAVSAGQADLSGGLFLDNRCAGVPCVGGGLYAGGLLNITGTHFIDNGSYSSGGAVFTESPTTITAALFQGNTCIGPACEGGALNGRDTVTVNDSLILSNTAESGGGGVYAASGILIGSVFQGNRCVGSFCSGGALMVVGDSSVSATHFVSNTSLGDGGALYVDSPLTLTGSLLVDNVCTGNTCVGGGLYAERNLTVSDTQFIRNSASQGGGLHHSNTGNGRIVNTLFAGNVARSQLGAALLLASPDRIEVIHTTIANPMTIGGSALQVQAGTVYLTNTLIASHTVGISNTAGIVNQDYNLFFGNGRDTSGTLSGGTHSLTGDPKFANAAGDDYHLRAGSAAVDAGTNAGVPIDFEGDVRPENSGFDIGFDELSLRTVYLPLVMR